MSTIIPPPVPPSSTEQDPPGSRVHFRVQQIFLSIATLGVTVCLWKIHPILGIAAAFLAKHILVAILASGLTYPSSEPPSEPKTQNNQT